MTKQAFDKIAAGLTEAIEIARGNEKPARIHKTDTSAQNDHAVVATRLPPHPGEILREEFLAPLQLSVGKLAKACGIARSRLEHVAAEKIGISADTALRLGRVFGTTPEFWMNLQARYDLIWARAAVGEEIDKLAPLDHHAF